MNSYDFFLLNRCCREIPLNIHSPLSHPNAAEGYSAARVCNPATPERLSSGMDNTMWKTPSSLLYTALAIALACVLFHLAWPHAGALVGAAALGISFFPLHRWMRRRLPNRGPSFRAGLTSGLVVLFFVVPLVGMAWAAVAQTESWLPAAQSWRGTVAQWREGTIVDSSPAMKVFRGWMQKTFTVSRRELRMEVGRVVENALDSTVSAAEDIPAAMASYLLEIGLMVVALFFVFRDGEKMYVRFQEYLPLSDFQKTASRERICGMVTGVVRGWLLCAIAQGILATVAYGLAGVKGWILFGCLTMLAGLLPFVGTALVWVPLALIQVTGGHVGSGIFLALWGVLRREPDGQFPETLFHGAPRQHPFHFSLLRSPGRARIVGPQRSPFRADPGRDLPRDLREGEKSTPRGNPGSTP
jgi:predicted PurR-regulated permease PerM